MLPFETFYDVLSVSRFAPIEVIRAAHKTLSQRYHPDKVFSAYEKEQATQKMQKINQAFEVLSNDIKRKEYDNWLLSQENLYNQNHTTGVNKNKIVVSIDYGNAFEKSKEMAEKSKIFANQAKTNFSQNVQVISSATTSAIENLIHLIFKLLCYAGVMGIVWLGIQFVVQTATGKDPLASIQNSSLNSTQETSSSNDTGSNNQENTNTEPVYKSASHLKAPNGQPFPKSAGYVRGYPKLNMDGLSMITVDNSQNSANIFGKLVYLGNGDPKTVRSFFIPSGGGLVLRNVTIGEYDIRYKDLEDNQIAKSESFSVQEINEGTGTQFSNITMTLYKVANGNMQTTPISENEFN